MNKEVEQALERLYSTAKVADSLHMNNLHPSEEPYTKEEKIELRNITKKQYNTIRQELTKLERIEEVVKGIKTLSGDSYDYEQINKIKSILEEE